MATTQDSPSTTWKNVPMGPHLRRYLQLSEESLAPPEGEPWSLSPEAEDRARKELDRHLRDSFIQRAQKGQGLSPEDVVDLLDELVTMAMPNAALELASAYPHALTQEDFRAQLALGVAAMMVQDFAKAEKALCLAQGLLPDEPAPYVNLVQIFRAQDRLKEAEIWCLAGLDAERDNHHLWELLAMIYRDEMGEYMPEHLLKVAEKKTSWAGASLASSLVATGDRYFKATVLEKYYFQGERDPFFLIELTGAYGIAGDHAKIPPIVWQAERMTTKNLPWQLHAHAAQAQLALGRLDEFRSELAKARRDPHLPTEAAAALGELEDEAAMGVVPH